MIDIWSLTHQKLHLLWFLDFSFFFKIMGSGQKNISEMDIFLEQLYKLEF